MLSRRNAWSAILLCAVLALTAAPAAFAQSAGNQQYVDPLASTTPSSSAPSSSTGSSPAPSSSSASASASSAPASSTSSSSSSNTPTASTSAGTPAASSSRTLPFTGLDLWPAVAVGFGLIGSGLAIRRLAHRP